MLGGVGAAEALSGKLGEYGAEKIYAAEGDEIDGYLVAPKATVLAELVKRVQPAAVLLASAQEGKEIAARLAVKLDNGILTDVVGLDADGTATQVAFAGSAIVKSKVTKGLPLVTVRPNSVTPPRRRPPRRSSSSVCRSPTPTSWQLSSSGSPSRRAPAPS